MPLLPIQPQAARLLMEQGAVLVDIRGADEYAREHIAQARQWPIGHLARKALADVVGPGATALIFYCRSGQRTRMNERTLQACAACDAYRIEGGIDAWKQVGLPVVTDASQPIELMRQVQIAAGSLVLLGVALGSAVSPWWYGLTAFVGGGLVFAGVSGFCGLARILARMPWNRRALGG